MKPFLHGRISAKKWGGRPEDYQAIHDFIDSSKAHFPDMRHRALLHSSFGIYLTERVFGINMTNSDSRLVSVRDIAEQHVLDDMGTIPTVQDYLEGMPMYEWLGGKARPPAKRDDVAPVVRTAEAPLTKAEEAKSAADMFREYVAKRKTQPVSEPQEFYYGANPSFEDSLSALSTLKKDYLD